MHRGIVFTWDPLLHTDLRRGLNELFLHLGGLQIIGYSVIIDQFEECGHRPAVTLDRICNKDLKNNLFFR